MSQPDPTVQPAAARAAATVLAIATGGAAGAGLRWLVGRATSETLGGGQLGSTDFDGSTLLVNVLGCLVLGWVSAALQQAESPGRRSVLIGVGTGFCGALTTFATFAVGVAAQMSDGAWATAGATLVATILLGVLAVLAGRQLHRIAPLPPDMSTEFQVPAP